MTDNVAPVMIRIQLLLSLASLEKKAIPTGMVNMSSLCVIISGHINEFQLPRKVRIHRVASADLLRGIAIWKRILHSPIPSIRAASSSSEGNESINCLIRKIPKPDIRPGNKIPQ
ncbi:hypothetical protein D3C80_1634570 [compost metagenome]